MAANRLARAGPVMARHLSCGDPVEWLPGPAPALTARSWSPSTRAFTDRRRDGPGIGYPDDLTLMGAHNRLCAHSQLRLVVSAE